MKAYHDNKSSGKGGTFLLAVILAVASFSSATITTNALSLPSSSSFHGSQLVTTTVASSSRGRPPAGISNLVMRKQKASDKRTARLQRGEIDIPSSPISSSSSSSFIKNTSTSTATQILSSSPMTKSQWKKKKIELRAAGGINTNIIGNDGSGNSGGGGRGRARKRLKLYNSLASYHSTFLELISMEYQMEEQEVITRLESSIADPFSLEKSGQALFDIHPQRRGNLFNDEVYRLEKALDATTTFYPDENDDDNDDNDAEYSSLDKGINNKIKSSNNKYNNNKPSPLPPNHKFSRNDVIVLSLQPRGTGDFLGTSSLPTNKDAVLVEARVLNVGPYYLDVAIPSGKFSNSFGPASNNVGEEGKGDPNLRVRADRFFSDVPFKRMVAALGQLTAVPEQQQQQQQNVQKKQQQPHGGGGGGGKSVVDKRVGGFKMDNLLKEVILSTFANADEMNFMLDGISDPNLGDLPKKLAKPPLPTSAQLANQVMNYIRTNPSNLFPRYNEPQLTAIQAALTRRLTLIQGPPGTGKTTTAGSIAFGFVHQCRSISPNCKVLATAFSNVGADNLAEKFLSLGLKVVRVGKPSGVSESLWGYTLDAAIQRDPMAQKALEDAARITAKIKVGGDDIKRKNKDSVMRAKRGAATEAVRASIQACNIAATRALREADVIVATSIGAADAQLLAACGIYPDEDDEDKKKFDTSSQSTTPFGIVREFAPDNLPPLSTPFVIVDEACQSVEPASLIPIVATNSCRSLVMLGDPCQLPPTVRSDVSSAGESPLSISLMSRLASILPPPVIVSAQKDNSQLEHKFLQCKPTRQAVSKVVDATNNISYRKRFAGSLLLSVQYRMHPSIAAFSSAVFYDGLLSSPLPLTSLRKLPPQLKSNYPVSNSDISVRFIQVGGRNNEYKGELVESVEPVPTPLAVVDPASSSYRNEAEAREILTLLKSLLQQSGSSDAPPFHGSIGIVTPYSAQVALIKAMMAADKDFRELAQSFPSEIEVKSVDAYQGRERDIIIFSAVRSNRHGRIGFLTDWRRMNVALTRAKNGLVVFGDAETLTAGDKHWSAFVSWCASMGCYVDNSSLQ